MLLAALGAVFLKGFREAIGLAVVLVVLYLALNVVVIGWGSGYIVSASRSCCRRGARRCSRSTAACSIDDRLSSLILFPKLALGLSGFETGVAVMPLVKGDPSDTEEKPAGRIRGARKLLLTAALIMSVAADRQQLRHDAADPARGASAQGGAANGRALAYLAHEHFGEVFGTLYDISTISILWFAGASAMAGLLNLVPRYLPRYGMAPDWAKAMRPLVLVFTGITFLVTIIFHADVDAQGGAYATGVLVLMTSAARGGDAARVAARGSGWMPFLVDHAGLRLHDHHQHHRAAGRHPDRVVLHRDDHR